MVEQPFSICIIVELQFGGVTRGVSFALERVQQHDNRISRHPDCYYVLRVGHLSP